MAIWGKIFGGISGFAVGGPSGALMGLALGHLADKKQLLDPPSGTWAGHFNKKGAPDPNSATFFTAAKMAALIGKYDQLYGIAAITLCAKMARIDGPVNKAEIRAFKNSFRFPEKDSHHVGLMFDQARNRTDDFEMYAHELGTAFANKPEPLETLLAVLFHVARADLTLGTPLHPAEQDFLTRVYKAFRLPPGAWDRAEKGQPNTSSSRNAPDAYRILGMARNASNAEIRTRWRALIRQYHPDALAQHPITDTQRAAAQEQVAQINAAWDQIKRERGL